MEKLIEIIKQTARDEIYLVGGAVRDKLLQREITDYDFAYTGNAFELAKELAKKLDASFVPLDQKRDVARLVIRAKEKNIYLDFSTLKGKDIKSDLQNRDFTINAMAYSLSSNLLEIIDPLNAKADLVAKRIVAISENNLLADPCRILRGIRLSVELDYEITIETLGLFKKHSKELLKTSRERIRDEIFRAFNYDAYKCVNLIEASNVLEVIFPEIFAAKGVTQNKHHTMDVWNHILEVIKQLEQNVLTDKHLINKDIERYLDTTLVLGRSKKDLLKFAALLHDVGKPVVRKNHPQKGIIFWNHENVGAEIANKISHRLMLSRKEIQFITMLVRNHMRLLFLVNAKGTTKAYNKFFNDTGVDGIAVLLHAYADSKGGKAADPGKEQALQELINNMMQFYFKEYLPQQQYPLINGSDILSVLPNIKPEKIGGILTKVQEQRAIGKIKSFDQAIQYVIKLKDN